MNPHQYSTGGASQRDMVSYTMTRDNYFGRSLFGEIGQMILLTDISGPIDAPTEILAGAMNSTDCCNGRGAPVPYPTLTRREPT